MEAHAAFAHPASAISLEIFRLNGALIAAGDALVAELGLTSARWQVMGAVAQTGAGRTVSQIARDMGLTRQSVQRLVNELASDGVVDFEPNPHHRRARLVVLTARGTVLFDEVMARWQPLADALVQDLSPRRVGDTVKTLRLLRSRLESGSLR